MLDLSSSYPNNPTGSGPNSQNGLQFVDSASHFGGRHSSPPPLSDPSVDAFNTPSTNQDSSFTPAFLKTALHPGICLFHLLFKAMSLLSFIFGSFIFGGWDGDYVFSFVTTTLFLSMDFWTVKNITGRLLVGMRWWNNIKPDGSNEWMYESHTDERVINVTDKTVFWTALYLWPLCWIVFLIIYILRLEMEWVLLVLLGVSLSSANLVGYWRCSKEAKRRVQQWATNQMFQSVIGRFIG